MAPNVRKIMIYFTAVTSMTRELGARGKSAVFTIRGLYDFHSGAGFCKAQILLQNLIFDFETCPNYQKVT